MVRWAPGRTCSRGADSASRDSHVTTRSTGASTGFRYGTITVVATLGSPARIAASSAVRLTAWRPYR